MYSSSPDGSNMADGYADHSCSNALDFTSSSASWIKQRAHVIVLSSRSTCDVADILFGSDSCCPNVVNFFGLIFFIFC